MLVRTSKLWFVILLEGCNLYIPFSSIGSCIKTDGNSFFLQLLSPSSSSTALVFVEWGRGSGTDIFICSGLETIGFSVSS